MSYEFSLAEPMILPVHTAQSGKLFVYNHVFCEKNLKICRQLLHFSHGMVY